MRAAKIALSALFVAISVISFSEEKLLTIVHTNDLHSHLQGFSPELDYTPFSINDDTTVGGWARIATVIREIKEERKNPVLVLDAGDFMMGTLFHMLSREESFELSLMKAMGYGAVGLGNHEFDLTPDGLARILMAGKRKGMPHVLFASAIFSPQSAKDDTLEKLFVEGLVRPYTVLVENGVRIGIFAIIGKDAAEVAPFAAPVKFRKPVEIAREMVKVLREKEKSDIVICLSHSGLSPNKTKAEDEILAKEAPGIDVIVSGHTHTNLAAPIVVGATIIVQAWVLGMQVGVLDIGWDGKRVTLKGWKPVSIDDSIPGTLEIQRTIDSAMREIDDMVLKERGLSFYKILAETNGDMRSPLAESGLGNMVADMIRWYVDKHDSNPGDPLSKVAFAVESNGVLRDDLERGKTGRISVADLFRVVPLGFGVDDSMGYPLVSVYLTAAEIKKALEVVTSVYPLKGSDYFLQVSGVRFTFNPRRMLFDRVTGIWIGSEEEGYAPLDYSRRNTRLYRVVANYYNSAFLKLIGSFTYHILDIVPKDRNGMPIKDLAAARVDADKKKPGIQELKEWAGLIEYVRQFPDTNGDGVPDIPVKYLEHLGRNVSQPSWNPVALLSHGTFVTWTAFGVVLFLIAMVVLAVSLVVRAMKKKAPRVLP